MIKTIFLTIITASFFSTSLITTVDFVLKKKINSAKSFDASSKATRHK